jgi:hypothetical protein
MNTKLPIRKINQIQRFIQGDISSFTVEEIADTLTKKYNVGVYILYGRLKGQYHGFEIYRMYMGEWKELLCIIDVEVTKFKQEVI